MPTVLLVKFSHNAPTETPFWHL